MRRPNGNKGFLGNEGSGDGRGGFIGYSLAVKLLARGDSVIGIDMVNDYYDVTLKEARIARLREMGGNRFTFVRQDFSQYEPLVESLSGLEFERIVHLGAQAGVRYSITHPHAYLHSNLAGHLNMLEIGRHRGVENMVYASSSSVYGGNTKLPFAVEDRVDQPISLYAATKKADELMSETYAHLYRLPLTGLRFLPSMVRGAARHDDVDLYQGHRRRPAHPRLQQWRHVPRFHLYRRHHRGRHRHRSTTPPPTMARSRRAAPPSPTASTTSATTNPNT
jgi:nucleoside-diphosphate-sugar epimerase